MRDIVFIDTEVDVKLNVAKDFGAFKSEVDIYHGKSGTAFANFIKDSYFICGHNIIEHDYKYFQKYILQNKYIYIDTLHISPLIYPKKIHHNLLKDDKLSKEELNNPLNDAIKAKDLFYCEVAAFEAMDTIFKNIYGTLLHNREKFYGFFDYVNWSMSKNLENDIKEAFKGKICENIDLNMLITKYPIELSYALSLINTTDKSDIPSPWVNINYPNVNTVMKILRGKPCLKMCDYCKKQYDPKKRLTEIFTHKDFKTYEGEPLQEMAVRAAIEGKSLLAIFPTGGGKSLAFQLPALIAGEASKGLTVVISPLQSLMKDQVDGLEKKGIVDAVTINGMLDPIKRKEAIDRVLSGRASILYISPELLRSKTIERIMLSRNIERIVIDEAHCFSSWGQDFRIDYLYIGDFINKIQEKKQLNYKIPVSCFTATAKQKVIADICDYFKSKLGLSLDIFSTSSTRKNLHYKVELKENDEAKYEALRDLIKAKQCPTIVYVSTTALAEKIATKLKKDGIKALEFHGRMDKNIKINHQEKFINNEVQVIVATSAFGMGVDKSDVKLVVHYEISDSLENYIQEAGRAGRGGEHIDAECIVFYNEDDLEKHFMLLNLSKLSMKEINQIWKGIKSLTTKTDTISRSALEIARAAGWDKSIYEVETRVKTAIAALEAAGYVSRGLNSPKVFATSVQVRSVIDARKIMDNSDLFDEQEKETATRIISFLISKKSRSVANNDLAESRVDYISDMLGIEKTKTINLIDKMRQLKILADHNDMTAYIKESESHRIFNEFEKFSQLERFMIRYIKDGRQYIDLKVLNDAAIKERVKGATIKNIRTILFIWTIKGYIHKTMKFSEKNYEIDTILKINEISNLMEKRIQLSAFIMEYLHKKSVDCSRDMFEFSMVELIEAYNNRNDLFSNDFKCYNEEVQDALLYLSKTNIITIEGGFLVLYNAMQIKRKVLDNKIQYKNEDYKNLKEHYNLKVQQIHIVGEYANMMVKDYNQALEFVRDYFSLQYDGFIKKYFKGDRKGEIKRNITPTRYNKLFGDLSLAQKRIIDDENSKYISVLAGPGSGKTRVLVHKLASLLLLEDVKPEQLLMLTFSRAAATEFKIKLMNLIHETAHFVDIKTFHSYCFDLLGKLGNKDDLSDVIGVAAQMIENGEVEQSKITKTVLVIDEAQDMDAKDFRLVNALINKNPDMKVIAVGDDDQNIYEFRYSSSKYMKMLLDKGEESTQYNLLENYRSTKKVIDFSNAFAKTIKNRMKRDPIMYVRKDLGFVQIVNHVSQNLEEPVVNHVIENRDTNKKVAILTSTNEEALKVLCLLNKKGVKAKLIQSNDQFNLYNLMELRDFINYINSKDDSPIITNELWNEAVDKMCEKYANSSALDFIKNIVYKFDKTHAYKYKTDFIEFIRESKYEDFFDLNQEKVIVSTIHKAKGLEFDSVYILLNNQSLNNDEEKRKVYVAMTRAKTNLYIHCNNGLFDNFKNYAYYINDTNIYSEPDKIMIQLNHHDVVLGDFKQEEHIKEVLNSRSGDLLEIYRNHLYIKGSKCRKLFEFSHKFKETFSSLIEKGYIVEKININHIVYWKDPDEINGRDYPIILPNIYLSKNEEDNKKNKINKIKELCQNIIDGYKTLNKYSYFCGKIALCKYLRGSKTQKFKSLKACEEKYYGIHKELTEKEILEIIRLLIKYGVFKETGGLYSVLKIMSNLETVNFESFFEEFMS